MTSGFDALPPWDAAVWFQATKRSQIALIASTATQIVTGDPMRVALCVCAPAAVDVYLDIQPNVPVGTAPPFGILVNQYNPFCVIRFDELGPFAQSPFWAYTAATTVVLVAYEIRLREWPKPRRQRYGQTPHPPQPGVPPLASPAAKGAPPQVTVYDIGLRDWPQPRR